MAAPAMSTLRRHATGGLVACTYAASIWSKHHAARICSLRPRVGVGEDNETEVARLARNEGPHAMAAYAEAALYASGEVVFNSRTGMSGNVRFGVRSQDGYLMKILWFNRQGEADQGAVSVDSRVVSEVVLSVFHSL